MFRGAKVYMWRWISFILASWWGASLHAASAPDFWPLEKGNRWVYEGTVSWTSMLGDAAVLRGTKITNAYGDHWTILKATNGVWTARVRWVTEVLETFETGTAFSAVVRGYPADLAGAEAGANPACRLLFSVSNQLWSVTEESESQAMDDARELVKSPHLLPESAELLIDSPLDLDRRWGGDVERKDGWYCWRVERKSKKPLRVKGISIAPRMEVFSLAYRTCPDHTLVEFSPGVGCISFVYEHHGTVASEHVRLVEFQSRDSIAK